MMKAAGTLAGVGLYGLITGHGWTPMDMLGIAAVLAVLAVLGHWVKAIIGAPKPTEEG